MKGLDCQFAVVMSVWGQQRRFERVPATSGVPPSADIVAIRRHVSPQTEVVDGRVT